MSTTDDKKMTWAAGLANKLRMVQANWAEDDPAAREEYLEEEIERALNEVSPEKRLLYLKALAKNFPEWQAPEPTPTIPEKKEKPSELTPEVLVKRLSEQASQLTEQIRMKYAKILHEAGFKLPVAAVKEKSDTVEEMPQELSRRLRLPLGKEINTQLAVKMLAYLLDMVLTLDQLGWNMWKKMAPRSRIRHDTSPQGDLRSLAGRYLTGDPDASLAQVTQTLERTRQLLAGLLGAIGPVGRTYSRRNAVKYSPTAIRELVRLEPGKIWDSTDVRCWKKYIELAKDLTEESVEKQIHEAIVYFAEELMMGSNRSSKNST